MKIHKLTICVIDFDELGATEVVSTIENQKYPNRCISPSVLSVETKDIGDWSDDHPLNNTKKYEEEIIRIFS